jgi:phospholipid/cholesterol/gamma-HCH transport system substrate-binding protein
MKSFRDRSPYAVGIASVLVVALFTGMAFAVGLLHLLEHTYSMEGVFSDAAGLRKGDAVKVAGVKVGRVTGIEADRRNGHVIVTWVVNDGVKVGREATAEIALETLLGAKFVRLGAHPQAPFMQDLPKAKRVVPMSRTKTPFDVFELTRIATENIETLHTDELNQLVTNLADITQDKHQSVTELIDGLDKVSSAIDQRDTQLRSLLDRADKLSGTLADKDQTLVKLIDASQKILELIANRRDSLAQALGEGSAAVQQLSKVIGDHQAELDRILGNLDATLQVVARNQPELDKTLAWIGPAFYDQTLAGSNGPWLDVFIRSLGPLDPSQTICQLVQPGATTCP